MISINHHHHHHVVSPARIFLTLSRHFSISFIASGRSQGYNPYPHIAAVCMFELIILLLNGHMWGSIGVHHLWARLCFSISVLRVILESLMPLKNWFSSHARCSESSLKYPIRSVSFFTSFKHNFIAYHSSKVSDCILEIHHLWQSGFSRVYCTIFTINAMCERTYNVHNDRT